jgi:hypothetical protein
MKKYIAIGILLAVSLGINIWFLSGKGIMVNQDRRVINNNNNSQWQGQLLINQWNTQGDKIEWKLVKCLLENVPIELSKLHPISSFYCKITLHANSAWVDLIYPEIFTEKK